MNMLPPSPMKVRAGRPAHREFQGRNPHSAPSRASTTTANCDRPWATSAKANTPPATATMPAARPSSPSMKFTLTVTPITNKTVAGQASQPSSSQTASMPPTESIRTPDPQSASAAATRTSSL